MEFTKNPVTTIVQETKIMLFSTTFTHKFCTDYTKLINELTAGTKPSSSLIDLWGGITQLCSGYIVLDDKQDEFQGVMRRHGGEGGVKR